MYFYSKEINKAVPIQDVMAYYGLDVALNRNVRCPSPKHEDKTASAKIYTKTNTCHCFSCGSNFTPLKIVSEMEGLSNKELPKACEMLCDMFGLDKTQFGEYQESDYQFEPQASKKDVFPFSYKELALIGLAEGLTPTKFKPEYEVDIYETDEHGENVLDEYGEPIYYGSQTYSYGEEVEMPTLRDLYDEKSEWCDREMLFSLVASRTVTEIEKRKEHIEKLNELIEGYEKAPDFKECENCVKIYENAKWYRNDWREDIPQGMTEKEFSDKCTNYYFYKDFVVDKNEEVTALGMLNGMFDKCEDFVKKNAITLGGEETAETPKARNPWNKGMVKMQSYGKSDVNLSKNLKIESRSVGKTD